jgi:hypothetical protein
MLLLIGFELILRLGRRWPAAAPPLLLFAHLAAQVWVLQPLVPTDAVARFVRPPDLLEQLPVGGLVTHGEAEGLFGEQETFRPPDLRMVHASRWAFARLHPAAGILHGRTYAFANSPEGLDSFLSRVTAQAIERIPDHERIRLLAASGVRYLVLDRALNSVSEGAARLLGRYESGWGPIWIYRVGRPAPEVYLARGVHRAPHINAAVKILGDGGFDPAGEVVIPGDGPYREAAGGVVRVERTAPELLELEVEVEDEGVLVVQRPLLPIWRATVDGVETSIFAANIHRMGLSVGPGRHQVRLWIDRRPLRWSLALSAAAAILLIGLFLAPWVKARRAGMI